MHLMLQAASGSPDHKLSSLTPHIIMKLWEIYVTEIFSWFAVLIAFSCAFKTCRSTTKIFNTQEMALMFCIK